VLVLNVDRVLDADGEPIATTALDSFVPMSLIVDVERVDGAYRPLPGQSTIRLEDDRLHAGTPSPATPGDDLQGAPTT
jgi:hypothetical protein